MEETKLDKAVDKLFKFVGKFSDGITNLAKGSGLYFRLFSAFFYMLYIIVFFIDVYYHSWKFTNLSDGKINISFFSQLFMVFIVIPLQIYFFNRNLFNDLDLKILKLSQHFYIETVVNNCFKPLVADWREEYSNARHQNHKWQAFSINLRYTYAFISAVIQQSFLRHLLEFIRFIK